MAIAAGFDQSSGLVSFDMTLSLSLFFFSVWLLPLSIA
jgi:hypothetical protein